MTRLAFVARTSGSSGYGTLLINFVRELSRRSIYAVIRSTDGTPNLPGDVLGHVVRSAQPEPTEILLASPLDARALPTPGKRTAWFTMWESTELPKKAVERLNLADLVIVPTPWNKEAFINSGVTKPVEVVPLGVDTDLYKPTGWPSAPPFKFGAAGELLNGRSRKGIDDVILCFKAVFRNNSSVSLDVKLGSGCSLPDQKDPRIKIMAADWTDARVASWLNDIHCFVSAPKGEGWGMWQHQAAACARLVIAPIYGGLNHLSTAAQNVTWQETPADEAMWAGNWCQPDLTSLCEMMRVAADLPAEAQARGKLCAVTANQFTWKQSVDVFLSVLHRHGFGLLPQPVRQVPWPITRVAARRGISEIGYQAVESGFESYCRLGLQDPAGKVWFNAGYLGDEIVARGAVFDPKTGERARSALGVFHPDGKFRRILQHPCSLEDPRGMIVGQDKYVSCAVVRHERCPAQQALIKVDDSFQMISEHRVIYGDNNGAGPEKNWIWFSDRYRFLNCIYHIEPHTVLVVDEKFSVSAEIINYQPFAKWHYGRPRGGTNVVRRGDEWISVFHSSLPWKSGRCRYWVGIYAFSVDPPYRITRYSHRPILEGVPNDESRWIIPQCVIFPCGLKFDGKEWRMIMGINDEYCSEAIMRDSVLDKHLDTRP